MNTGKSVTNPTGIGIASHVAFGAGAFVLNPKFGPAPSHPKGSVHGRSGGGGVVGGSS